MDAEQKPTLTLRFGEKYRVGAMLMILVGAVVLILALYMGDKPSHTVGRYRSLFGLLPVEARMALIMAFGAALINGGLRLMRRVDRKDVAVQIDVRGVAAFGLVPDLIPWADVGRISEADNVFTVYRAVPIEATFFRAGRIGISIGCDGTDCSPDDVRRVLGAYRPDLMASRQEPSRKAPPPRSANTAPLQGRNSPEIDPRAWTG